MEIIYQISKNEKTWQEASVQVPQINNTSCIAQDRFTIHVDIESKYALMCCLLIKDSYGKIRMLRQIGYGPRDIQIGPDSMSTTAGGVPGDIPAGNWKIVLFVFREYLEQFLGDNSFEVKVQVANDPIEVKQMIGECDWMTDGYDFKRIYKEETKWYKGDFHTHTQLSDGKQTTRSAMKYANMMNLDFYIPTEHNAVHTGWPESDVMVVPGIEITTCLGHFNIFGQSMMPGRLLYILKHAGDADVWQEMEYTIGEAEENHWPWSINHPFLHIWKWKYDNLSLNRLHFMEIINDPTYTYAKEANEKAISFIDFLWNEGFKVYGIGGSDAHNLIEERYDGAAEPSVAGDPGTYVLSDGLSPERLISAMEKGHIYVSRKITLDIEYRWNGKKYFPGDHLRYSQASDINEPVRCIFRIDPTEEELHAFVADQYGCKPVRMTRTGSGYEAMFNYQWKGTSWEWMRIGVNNSKGEFIAYINPIYHGSRKSGLKTFGEAKKTWEA